MATFSFNINAAIATAVINAAVATSLTDDTKIKAKLSLDDAKKVIYGSSFECNNNKEDISLNLSTSLKLVKDSEEASKLASGSTLLSKKAEFANDEIKRVDYYVNSSIIMSSEAIKLANETNVKIATVNEFNKQYIKNLNNKKNKGVNINIDLSLIMLICGSGYLMSKWLEPFYVFNRY
jgi:hypothetical protein